MYFNYLVDGDRFDRFDPNLLSQYERYLFVVVLSDEDYRLTVKTMSVYAQASKALCFYLRRQDIDAMLAKPEMAAFHDLIQSCLLAEGAHSFVCVINRDDVWNAQPAGVYHGLFLGLEPDEAAKKLKLRKTIQMALASPEKPISTQLSDWIKMAGTPLLKVLAACLKSGGAV